MAKFHLFDDQSGLYGFDCPGCGYGHHVHTKKPNESGAMWQFNGDLDKPTVSPSLLVFKDYPARRCHSFIRDGKIQFLSDCFHVLAGQTVEIPEWD
jgi:hypothetical protein